MTMTMIMTNSKTREERAKQTAEVFTPNKLVCEMLAKLPKSVWKKGKTFCDPAVGNGQFLIWILLRKIQRGHKPLEALQCLYGADIMQDNIRECRLRLLKIISLFENVEELHIETVFQNIVWINQKTHPAGSLEYDFSFKRKAKRENVERWMEYIHENGVLDDVSLPVPPETFNKTGMVDIFAALDTDSQ